MQEKSVIGTGVSCIGSVSLVIQWSSLYAAPGEECRSSERVCRLLSFERCSCIIRRRLKRTPSSRGLIGSDGSWRAISTWQSTRHYSHHYLHTTIRKQQSAYNRSICAKVSLALIKLSWYLAMYWRTLGSLARSLTSSLVSLMSSPVVRQ